MGALNQSKAGLNAFSRDVGSISGGISSALKSIQAPFMALAGLVGGAAFMKGTVSETVAWTVAAQKLGRTLGITTEEASVLNVAIKSLHGDSDTFLAITAKMTRTLNTSESAFQKLGVATRESNGDLRGSQDVLLDTFEALGKMKGGTDANVASTQIFGRNFLEVQKYIKLTRDSMKAHREEAERLNLIVGAESVAATNRYRKSSEDLDLTLKGLKIRLGQELMPVMSDFNEAAAEEGPTAITVLGNCLKGLVELVDGAWSGFKMFSIGLVGVVNAIIGTIMTALGTAWGFLSKGIPGARAAFKKGNDGLKEDWAATLAALDSVGVAYMQRQEGRWNGTGPHAKGKALDVGGDKAETKEAREKVNLLETERNRLRAEGLKIQEQETLAQKEAVEFEEAKLALDETMERLRKEKKGGSLTDAAFRELSGTAAKQYADRLISIQEKIGKERERINAETLGQLSILEATGIEKQIEAERVKFAKINEARKKAGLEGFADEQLQENIAILKSREMLKLKDSSRWSATDGMMAGLDNFIQKSSNKFETWKQTVTQVLSGVQTAFASAFRGILSGQMSLSQGFKTIWKGIADTVIGALANIAAQYLTTAIAEAIFDKAQQTTAASSTAATTSQAVAETWAAYAPFPFVGPGLALAQIALMMGSIAAASAGAPAITKRAVGGLITSPQLTLMGEAGPELVAPESDFKDWTRNLTANIIHQERQSQAYAAMGGRYASMAAAQGAGGYGAALHVHLEGATVMGESVESSRIIGRGLKRVLDDYNRRNG